MAYAQGAMQQWQTKTHVVNECVPRSARMACFKKRARIGRHEGQSERVALEKTLTHGFVAIDAM